jgi:hypothetical protein
MFTVFSAVLLLVLVVIAGYVVVKFIGKKDKTREEKRKERIKFIRRFKLGKCAVIYIAAIPLYWMGYARTGVNALESFFIAINKCIALVVLRYDLEDLRPVILDEPIFAVAIYFCLFLVLINALLFTWSLLNQRVWAMWRTHRWKRTAEEKILILGYNPDNITIYNSELARCAKKGEERAKSKGKKGKAKPTECFARIVDELTDEQCSELYTENVQFIDTDNLFETVEKLLREVEDKQSERCAIIVNTGNDMKNIDICRKIRAVLKAEIEKGIAEGEPDSQDEELSEEEKEKRAEERAKKEREYVIGLFGRIRVFAFGDPEYDAVYTELVETSFGCLRYLNKYRQIAMDFIDKYPMSAFMGEEQVDFSTSLVREDVNLNVAMIGFGKTNQQIFLTSVANNQFLTEENGEIKNKAVRYYIFDKKHSENNKNLNHSYYRYQTEVLRELWKKDENGEVVLKDGKPVYDEAKTAEYLPLPPMPSEEIYRTLDVNDPAFYDTLKEMCKGKKDVNYIVIAFGTDLENIDMAQKLIEKKQEWDIANFVIFVKIRSGDDNFGIFSRPDCYAIGCEEKVVYDIGLILQDKLSDMAKLRHRVYAIEYEVCEARKNGKQPPDMKEVVANAQYKWHVRMSQLERDSNLYGVLSLKSKLHLMGLDYVPMTGEDKDALTEEEYLEIYAVGDKPKYYEDLTAEGKKIVEHGLIFKPSRRKTMAIHEHYRWNSYMFSRGIIPADKNTIETETVDGRRTNGKNYRIRRHGNLTTFEGLEEFRRIIWKRDGGEEAQADVIKYDYQILDDAVWFLGNQGYKIVKRT